MASRKKAKKAHAPVQPPAGKLKRAAQNAARMLASRPGQMRTYANLNMIGGTRNMPNTDVGPTEFYTFVIRCAMGEWRYVRVRDGFLYTGSCILQYFHGVTEDMLDLWKRIAIDHAIEFEDMVDPTTLRLVKVNFVHTDHTSSLFSDAGDYQHHRTLATLGKLTDDESRLLGVDGQRALYKMMHCPDEQSTDKGLMRRLTEAAIDCDQTIFLNSLP